MNQPHIHRAVSADGTEIAGRVHGQGPPLALVHGAFADGDLEWESLLPRLSERFTCYVMSTRGRGLSADHADHAPARIVEDVRAFVDSVGEPTALAGVSGGGMHALGAAAGNPAVRALAVYEPVVFEVMTRQDLARFRQAVLGSAQAVARGEPAVAAKTFLGFVANGEERAQLDEAHELLAIAGRHGVTDLLEFQHHVAGARGDGPTTASTLTGISAPTLILRGTASARESFAAAADHVAAHVTDSELREIEGAGHLAVALGDERIADEIVQFCAPGGLSRTAINAS